MNERQQRTWVVIGLVVAGIIAYANSFGGPFIFDDEPSIPENPNILHLWPLTKAMSAPEYTTISGRPIVSLSLALNYAVSGYSVWSYHAFNLLIHILAGLVLYVIVRRTLLSEKLRDRFSKHATMLAGLIAMIWLVHPLQTESVTYIIQRAESLMGLFFLLTLYCTIMAIQPGRPVGWYVLSIICCGLGMATKEVMVSAPVLVLLYDRAFAAGTFRGALRKRWGLYLGLAATWSVLGILVLSFPVSEQGTEFNLKAVLNYMLNQGLAILRYLQLTVWPKGLCLNYCWPVDTDLVRLGPPLLVILCLLAVTVWGGIRNFVWSYPAVWFFGVLALTSIAPLWAVAFEHRMYLSLAGPIALIVLAGYILLEYLAVRFFFIGRYAYQTGVVLTAAVIIVFILLTLQRNKDYRSSESIWRATLKIAPINPTAYSYLGAALAEQGRYDEAIDCYRWAVYIEPRRYTAYYSLGNVYDKLGRLEEAIKAFKEAIKLKSNYAKAYNRLGIIYGKLNRNEEAMNAFKEAIKIDPNRAEIYCNLGLMYGNLGQWKDAAEACRIAIQNRPDYIEAHYGLGLCYVALGERDSALEEYKILKTLDKSWADELFKQIPH